jgi:predicted nuclease of predicted toxin-antitoxin system
MTILFDENIPRKLKWHLMERGVDVVTVPERGWAGVKNGELLNRAEEAFDVLLTMDQGIEYQQNLAGREMAIV